MSESSSLRGKVAIVTGGARGIGYAIANEFVQQDANVVVVDNGVAIDGNQPDASLVAHALGGLGNRVAILAEDVAATDTAAKAVKLAMERFGGVDILVNNAAILRDAFIFKSDRSNWEKVISTNLTGAWAMLAAATPVMRDAIKSGREPGRIVNLISTAGLYGNFGQAAYASAKAGLVGLTRVTAMDMARSKVFCNAVAPFASTRVTQSIQPANEAQAEYKARALKVPAAYVAKLVAWLGSSGCKVTGQIFGVRGREVFLFTQPRPVASVVTAALESVNLDNMGAELTRAFANYFTDLATDLEAFNTDPLL